MDKRYIKKKIHREERDRRRYKYREIYTRNKHTHRKDIYMKGPKNRANI